MVMRCVVRVGLAECIELAERIELIERAELA